MFSYLLVGHAQDTKRKILKKVPAEYPQILKDKGIGGTVRLKVFIRPDGSVKDTEVLGGNPILVESAQKSVKQWKFSPLNSDSNEEVVVNFHPATEQGN
jgi:TonB family protein